MVEVELKEEYRLLKDLVRRFVNDELLPLERDVMARAAAGEGIALNQSEKEAVDRRAKELGLRALDAPAEFGGFDLPAEAMVGVDEEIAKTIVHYAIPPDSPNLHMLIAAASPEQREKYLRPYARGETISAMAISEPGAGSDPRRMSTRAAWTGDSWVLNGRKIWISKAGEADFTIAMAVSSRDDGGSGISAFIVDRGTPGFNILRRIPMLGGLFTYEIAFEDCRLPASALLGAEGQGFAPMQKRLSVRRLQMGAWCVGIAQRALDILIEHASQRTTFGTLLSQRQAVQWWAADAATKIHATRLMVYDAARKVDQGREVRLELSMIKIFSTEMATEIIDKAMQTLGAMGMTKEIPLYLMAEKVRWIRVGEGPSEVHRWVVARSLFGNASAQRR